MAMIIDTDELKRKRENGQIECPLVNKDIMEQIMVDPMGCLNDDVFMLEHVVENGINCSLLCEALNVEQLVINIDGNEYRMFYCKPHPMFEHSDVMFGTKKFKKYRNGPIIAKEKLKNELKLDSERLQPSKFKPGMPPVFQQV